MALILFPYRHEAAVGEHEVALILSQGVLWLPATVVMGAVIVAALGGMLKTRITDATPCSLVPSSSIVSERAG